MRRLNVPGVSLAIVEAERIVHTRGFGRARPGGETPTPRTAFVLGSITESFTALVITVLVWCRDYFNRQGRLLRAMSAASYAVYVLHPLLTVLLALALSGIRLDLGLKFLLVAPLAVILCFLVGNLVRELPLVRGVL
jgi:hypothetical protein